MRSPLLILLKITVLSCNQMLGLNPLVFPFLPRLTSASTWIFQQTRQILTYSRDTLQFSQQPCTKYIETSNEKLFVDLINLRPVKVRALLFFHVGVHKLCSEAVWIHWCRADKVSVLCIILLMNVCIGNRSIWETIRDWLYTWTDRKMSDLFTNTNNPYPFREKKETNQP